jgi:hypothetical protein
MAVALSMVATVLIAIWLLFVVGLVPLAAPIWTIPAPLAVLIWIVPFTAIVLAVRALLLT